ncbi:hypothetical protein A2U01_0042460 [Trifolium medium]|uniref:Uncharacterized protein n=1 Tax=Trifolium medium TaxID=97028 RepID=A0A392QAX5_9FABA|nr:hypothetical protein [Trifolium medium]
MLNSIFINGLKEEIQAELKLHESHDLDTLMDRALLIEEKNEVMLRRGAGWKDRGGTFRFKDPGEISGAKKGVERRSTETNEKWRSNKQLHNYQAGRGIGVEGGEHSHLCD